MEITGTVKLRILVSFLFLIGYCSTTIAGKQKTKEECEKEYLDCIDGAAKDFDDAQRQAEAEFIGDKILAKYNYDQCVCCGEKDWYQCKLDYEEAMRKAEEDYREKLEQAPLDYEDALEKCDSILSACLDSVPRI